MEVYGATTELDGFPKAIFEHTRQRNLAMVNLPFIIASTLGIPGVILPQSPNQH
jgi:hypothetical protein